jgi:DNA-binding CsgD family transcriptional regulator
VVTDVRHNGWMDHVPAADRPIVGRIAERAALAGMVAGLAAGTPFVTTLKGEAGSGKTTLLDEVARLARATEITVVSAVGNPMTIERPLASAFDLASAIGQIGVVDLRDNSAATDEAARADAAEVIADGLLDAALSAPLLVAIDDAQWLDAWSFHMLELLARRSATSSIGMVIAYRPHPSAPGLGRLAGSRSGVSSIELLPLTVDEVIELVASREGAAPGAALRDTVAAAHGNPFLIEEILASLRARDALVETAGHVDVRGEARPAIDVSRWFTEDDGQIESLLVIASLLGQRFTISELASASGRSTVALVEPITAALRSGLLRESDVDLCFRHDIIRDRLYDALPASVRHAMHREIAARQEERGVDAVRVAEQLVRAGAPDDRPWVDLLVRTVERLPPSQTPLAIACRRLAIEGPISEREVVQLTTELAWALLDDGRPDESRVLLEHALERSLDPATELQYRQLLSSSLFVLGRYPEVATVMEQMGNGGPHPLQPFAAAALPLFRGELDTAVRLAGELRSQPDISEPARILLIGVESQVLAMQGFLPGAVRLALEGLERFERAGRPILVARLSPHALTINVLTHSDAEAATIERRYIEGERLNQQLGLRTLSPLLSADYAEELFRQGRWDDAEAVIDTALGSIDDGASNVARRLLLSILAQIKCRRGLTNQAEPLMGRAALEPFGGVAVGLEWMLWTQSLMARRTDGPTAATGPLQILVGLVQGFGTLLRMNLVVPFAVETALGAGNRDLAQAYVDIASTLAERSQAPTCIAAATLASALATQDARLARLACEQYAATNRVFEHGDCLGRTALLLASKKATREARAVALEAISVFEEVGAGSDALVLARELQRHGLPIKVARPERPITGWSSLTESELRVATLVGAGLSNGEIASRLGIGRRTVETHLYRVFPKLNVVNRTELAMEAVRRTRP